MFKKFLDSLDKKLADDKKTKKFHWLIIAMGLGVGLMILSSFFKVEKGVVLDNPEEKTKATISSRGHQQLLMQDYEKDYQDQLSQILNKIVGVDDVSIMVNLDSTIIEDYALDTRESQQVTNELDKTGGNRSVSQNTTDKKVAHYKDSSQDMPVVVKKTKPQVRGILVVARGVENLEVKRAVIEAVQRTLDVPIHRISVLPKG